MAAPLSTSSATHAPTSPRSGSPRPNRRSGVGLGLTGGDFVVDQPEDGGTKPARIGAQSQPQHAPPVGEGHGAAALLVLEKAAWTRAWVRLDIRPWCTSTRSPHRSPDTRARRRAASA